MAKSRRSYTREFKLCDSLQDDASESGNGPDWIRTSNQGIMSLFRVVQHGFIKPVFQGNRVNVVQGGSYESGPFGYSMATQTEIRMSSRLSTESHGTPDCFLIALISKRFGYTCLSMRPSM
jgi:hypothetical protein